MNSSKHTCYYNGLIHTWDNVFPFEDYKKICDAVVALNYNYGMVDTYGKPPTGLIGKFEKDSVIFDRITSFVKNIKLIDQELISWYVNYFAPMEKALMHKDGTAWTCMYYINDKYTADDEGETKFFFDKGNLGGIEQKNSSELPIILSIAPIPNRIVLFRGNILHSATAFRTKPRFTVAFRYGDSND